MNMIHQHNWQFDLGQGEVASICETEVANAKNDEVVIVEVGRRASLPG